jgi:enamine deaminase RidA (YjgF/YER057c/UK114 family)
VIERVTAPGLSEPPGYSHAVVASGGRLITTAGAVLLQVIDNLGLALTAAGASGGDVLKTTVYVVSESRSDLSEVWRIIQESEMAAAASTLLGVLLLGYEGQLVEVEAIALTG